TYMPKWITDLEFGFGGINARLIASNVHDAVMTMVDGGCDLLLCYHHPRQPVQLAAGRYDMLVLGNESLRPYAYCDKTGQAQLVLPGSAAQPLAFLSYTSNAYFGRMVELILVDTKTPLYLEKHYETDMAEGLKMMALEGHGIAFLPESAVRSELRHKHLALADGGHPEWQVNLEIRLYRERPSLQRPGKPVIGRLWDYLVQQQVEQRLPRRRQRNLAVLAEPSGI
ncbi:MAG: LysR substrate-binding domain-containing protein, partial [Herbaspirillum sp.]